MSFSKEIQMIMSLTGVEEATASDALHRYETVESAIDALLEKPIVSGDRYIPAKPKVETGLTAEQEERCRKGRWLQDKVNVVFSVAHSKTRTPQDLEAPSASTSTAEAAPLPETGTETEKTSCEQLDVPSQTTPPDPQSVLPPRTGS
jgi:hypothetical protein